MSLTPNFGGLTSLKMLDKIDCPKVTSLPHTLGGLSSLQEMILSGCNQLTNSPDSFGSLGSLKHLDLDCCSKSDPGTSELRRLEQPTEHDDEALRPVTGHHHTRPLQYIVAARAGRGNACGEKGEGSWSLSVGIGGTIP